MNECAMLNANNMWDHNFVWHLNVFFRLILKPFSLNNKSTALKAPITQLYFFSMLVHSFF